MTVGSRILDQLFDYPRGGLGSAILGPDLRGGVSRGAAVPYLTVGLRARACPAPAFPGLA